MIRPHLASLLLSSPSLVSSKVIEFTGETEAFQQANLREKVVLHETESMQYHAHEIEK